MLLLLLLLLLPTTATCLMLWAAAWRVMEVKGENVVETCLSMVVEARAAA